MDAEKLQVTMEITQAMVDELTDYLLGGQVYRQLVVQTAAGTLQPRMSLSSLLANLQELAWRREELTPEQQQRLDDMLRQVNLARGAFRMQWYELLQSEMRGLLSSWRWYLEDAAHKAQARRDYGNEVWIRNRLDLIMRELADDPAIGGDREALRELDGQLRRMWQSGAYVGPQDEEKRFPRSQAWWLYGGPAAGEE